MNGNGNISLQGRVASLHLHPAESGGKLRSVDAVELTAGQGIVGDVRYFGRMSRKTGKPTRRQVSIIAQEQIAEHAAVLDLMQLVGQQVSIGTAILHFYEARTPCEQMDAICTGLRNLMEDGKQGVMAEVVQSGRISIGDTIQAQRD